MAWKVLSDFLIGGFLVAFILLVAKAVGPFIGGIVAALPIRLGVAYGLAGAASGEAFATQMAIGALPGSLGALGFMVVLSRATRRLGITRSFLLACLACLIIVSLGYWIESVMLWQ
ncbi:MAG: hypothetical protein ACE5FW_03105 [Candidatus Aenigmatarchaeota archaeon]